GPHLGGFLEGRRRRALRPGGGAGTGYERPCGPHGQVEGAETPPRGGESVRVVECRGGCGGAGRRRCCPARGDLMSSSDGQQVLGGCPSRSELKAFGSGRLPQPALNRIADHIEAPCPRCLAVLEEPVDGADPLLA